MERTPFFYGWLVLAATTLTTMATLPGQTVGISVFLDGIIDDMDTTRSVVASLYTGATLAGSLVLPRVGRFLDHRGPRLGVAVIGAGLTIACLWMSVAGSLFMLAIAFFGLRSMGQGSLGLVSQYTANQWFVRRRGLALGISVVGFSIGIAVVGSVFTALSDSFGWRGSYRILAVAVAVIVGLAGVGIFRDRPERYGLEPDGGFPDVGPERTPEPSVHPTVARRTAVFWLFTLGTAATSALGTGLQFHHFSIMGEAGLSRAEAALFFLPFGLASGVATLTSGWLVDRYPHRYVMAVSQGLLALVLWFGPVLSGSSQLIAYGMAVGGMAGIAGNVAATVYAHHFGRLHLGEIKGLASTVTIAASALGPLPFALGFDLTGSYVDVLRTAAIIPIVIMAWAVLIPQSDGVRHGRGPAATTDPPEHGDERQAEQHRHNGVAGSISPVPIDRPTEKRRRDR